MEEILHFTYKNFKLHGEWFKLDNIKLNECKHFADTVIDDIKNYRPLTDLQITQLESLTKEERLKVIQTFNTMFLSLESLIQ